MKTNEKKGNETKEAEFIMRKVTNPASFFGRVWINAAAQAEQTRRAKFPEKLLEPVQALKDLDGVALWEILERQRKSFAAGGKRDEDAPVNSQDEAVGVAPGGPMDCPAVQPAANFMPS